MLLSCERMTVDPSAVTEAGAGGDPSTALAPGASIGKYRLDRQLGAGGMGVVWAAFDPDLERAVAIKVLRAVDAVATLRTRLLREARAMARLKHPNVLTVYEVGTDRNRDYIAMELIDGGDLDAWLASKPPRAQILAALLAAGRGLAAAHDAGLIHRDLKPHNILRGRDGGVYVTDFGLARGQIEDGPEIVQGAVAATAVGSQPRAIDSVLDSPLTQTGVLIGTPAYMAPEQFAGRAPDPRSDQFAFCVTAWEAITGARPFSGKTLEELRVAAAGGAHGIAAPPEAVLPARIRSVLVRGLAPDPESRWPDMDAVLRALEAAIAPPRRSRVPMFVGITLGVVGFLTGVALYTRSRTAPQEQTPTPTLQITTTDPPSPAPPSPPAPPIQVVIPNMPPVKIEIPPVPLPIVPRPPAPSRDDSDSDADADDSDDSNTHDADSHSAPTPPAPPSPGLRRSPHGPRNPRAPHAPPPPPNPSATSRAARDCKPAAEAFGNAWSAQRRAAVVAKHRTEPEFVGIAALLDSVRHQWLSLYEATCAMPASETRQERLACLLENRGEIDEATQEAASDDSSLSMASFVSLNVAVATCRRDHE
jgi:serine/threonine protein kinase